MRPRDCIDEVSGNRMTKGTGGKARKKRRPQWRVGGLDKGIAAAAAAVLGQLYQWHPRSRRRKEPSPKPEPFDVRATFGELNQR